MMKHWKKKLDITKMKSLFTSFIIEIYERVIKWARINIDNT